MAILSISREYQSGGVEIGQAVAERLDYGFVDKKRILENLKEAGGHWLTLGEELDEVRPDLWEKFDWQYQGFVALIESIIYEYALKDRVVILGRGSQFLLQDIPHALRVRITAPFDVRVKRAELKNEMDRETADWLIKKTDHQRAGYARAIYGKNWEDAKHYDLIFDTGIKTMDQVTEELVKALEERDQRATEEGRRLLQGRALTAKVKAQIRTYPGIFIPTLDIFFDGQAIVVKGVVHGPRDYHLVDEIIHKIADPHPIKNKLHYRK